MLPESSAFAGDITNRLSDFMRSEVYPLEHSYSEFKADPRNLWKEWTELERLKQLARSKGLWNLFIPKEYGAASPGLSNFEYAPLAEMMGRILWASEVFNCSAPDTGNMEVLLRYGTSDQKAQWLEPLLKGMIRSTFLMTEPGVASSDATNIECEIRSSGEDYVVNGRKWFATNLYHPRNQIMIVMGKTDPAAARHYQQSMILVPANTDGVNFVRPLTVLGDMDSPAGHGEVELCDVRIPKSSILLGEGRGFEIAQGRLGPGRIHHCMRLIGAAQRSLELMCERVDSRVAFGRKLSEQSSIRKDIALSRCEIEQARLLTLTAALKMDKNGNKAARDWISMIKIVAPQMCQNVTDRAIQAFGAMGLSQDTCLPEFNAYARYARLADGPDEVHTSQLAKLTIASGKHLREETSANS